MSEIFNAMRTAAYVALLLLSITVLGLAANFANLFLPHIHADFVIFALVVSSISILVLILLFSWSQPRTEVIFLLLGAIIWVALAAWTQDIIGGVQCSDIQSGQTVPTKHNGTMSSMAYCREMKSIEAFSWVLFGIFLIFFWIVVALTSRAKALGNQYAWEMPVGELPWFGEWSGQGQYPGYPMFGYQQPQQPQGAMIMLPGGQMVQQQPGHSLIVQPNANGQAPTITQVPGVVQSVM